MYHGLTSLNAREDGDVLPRRPRHWGEGPLLDPVPVLQVGRLVHVLEAVTVPLGEAHEILYGGGRKVAFALLRGFLS